MFSLCSVVKGKMVIFSVEYESVTPASVEHGPDKEKRIQI